MSMLDEQIKELREAARNIQGNLGRCLYRRKDVDEMQQVSGMLFEAADTIEAQRNKLQGVIGTRYCELFGTPERAAQLIADNCEYLDYCGQCWVTVANCDGNYSTVLEWLKGDAE